MDGAGFGDERLLLQQFGSKVYPIYAALQPNSRRIIADITQRMAMGMAEFVGKDMKQGTTDVHQYNRYCHFVAGLVGEGLSRLFAASGLEKRSFAGELHLSDQMGLFLQKTNIIRDFLEDYVDKRAFWPQSVWKKYSETGDLGYFADQSNPGVRIRSLQCLNELVVDALELVPDCLEYMSKLQCVEIFRFCAIPQVMAIATLDKCYANPDVFTGVVKIRKGLSCKLILRTNNLSELHETFHSFSRSIMKTATKERRNGVIDPNFSRTIRACETICDLTRKRATAQSLSRSLRWMICFGLVIVAVLWQNLRALWPVIGSFDFGMEGQTLIRAGLIVFASIVYTGGPWSGKTNLKTADLLNGRTVV
jgi:farnesyl-diphosphate farnesyltransferase